ncbi:MAG: glycosyl transferase [Clostridia bacterium]|nr:glycosyl transferase [Clostridia bacterium]
MIPKIIHYVWLGGKELPDKYKQYIDGWKKLMPDYTIMEWNESNFDFSESVYATQAYKLKKFGFVPDYIRVAVLEQYGGFYLDTDVEVLKSFDELLNNQFVIGFENDANVETAILGSEPHHPYCQTLMKFYKKFPFTKKDKPNLTPSPIYFTYFLRRDYSLKLKPEYQLLKDKNGSEVAVYPPEYFTPLNFNTHEEHITENSYAVHRFANSWQSKKLKTAQDFVDGLRKVFGKKIFASFTRTYVRDGCRKVKRFVKKANKKITENSEKI